MSPYYQDDWLTVYHGDCKAVMAEMEPESVHCVVTSPPYWGLRDYGTATWEGGDEGCSHVEMATGMSDRNTLGPNGHLPPTNAANVGKALRYRDTCGKCGATRQDAQLGLEPTPEAYVANMVAVFREVRRVLRNDGTVWLNLGDSYSQSANTGGTASIQGSAKRMGAMNGHTRPIPSGLKPKDLVGIPWRVAFALQADGWYLRSDIIWSKPNPMPESVTDRPTKSHEYLFLLSKSARYYFDADAVREGYSDKTEWTYPQPDKAARAGVTTNGTGASTLRVQGDSGRNIRSVWTIATAPYPGAHFATFPPKLVEPCIKAGTSEKGVCPECGAQWERETLVEQVPTQTTNGREKQEAVTGWDRDKWPRTRKLVETTGWRPSCAHISPLPPRSAVVLDPFAGSGTTGMVAQSLSRRAVLIDLSLDYLGQLMDRNADIPLGLGS